MGIYNSKVEHDKPSQRKSSNTSCGTETEVVFLKKQQETRTTFITHNEADSGNETKALFVKRQHGTQKTSAEYNDPFLRKSSKQNNEQTKRGRYKGTAPMRINEEHGGNGTDDVAGGGSQVEQEQDIGPSGTPVAHNDDLERGKLVKQNQNERPKGTSGLSDQFKSKTSGTQCSSSYVQVKEIEPANQPEIKENYCETTEQPIANADTERKHNTTERPKGTSGLSDQFKSKTSGTQCSSSYVQVKEIEPANQPEIKENYCETTEQPIANADTERKHNTTERPKGTSGLSDQFKSKTSGTQCSSSYVQVKEIEPANQPEIKENYCETTEQPIANADTERKHNTTETFQEDEKMDTRATQEVLFNTAEVTREHKKKKKKKKKNLFDKMKHSKKNTIPDTHSSDRDDLEDTLTSEDKHTEIICMLKLDNQKLWDENSKLQTKVSEMEQIVDSNHGRTIADYKNQIASLKNENDDLKNRISRMISDLVTDNNPNITDLSDQNRPSKLGERFGELYNNEWTDACDSLNSMQLSDKEANDLLLHIIVKIDKECRRAVKDEMDKLETAILQVARCSKMTDDLKLSLKQYKDYRKKNYKSAVEVTNEFVQNLLPSGVQVTDSVDHYIRLGYELCWLMCIQDPPLYLIYDINENDPFDKIHFKEYMKSGSICDYVVWPAICLYENGPVIQKGVMQGKSEKNVKAEH